MAAELRCRTPQPAVRAAPRQLPRSDRTQVRHQPSFVHPDFTQEVRAGKAARRAGRRAAERQLLYCSCGAHTALSAPHTHGAHLQRGRPGASRPPSAEQSAGRGPAGRSARPAARLGPRGGGTPGGTAAPQRDPQRSARPTFPSEGAGRAAPRCLPRSGSRRTLPWLLRRRSGAERSLLRSAPGSGSGRSRPGAGRLVPALPRPALPGGGRRQRRSRPAEVRSHAPPLWGRPGLRAALVPCVTAVAPPGGQNSPLAAPLSRSRGGTLAVPSRRGRRGHPPPAQPGGFPAARPRRPAAVNALQLLGSPSAARLPRRDPKAAREPQSRA